VRAHRTQVVTLVFDQGVQGLADVVGEGGGGGDGWEAGCGDDLGVRRVVVSSCVFWNQVAWLLDLYLCSFGKVITEMMIQQ
jgi:hypothetical protein